MWILTQKPKAKSHGTINQKVKAKTGLCTLLHAACGTTGFLLFVTILSGVVLASSTTHADDAGTDTVNLTVEIACTLATGGGSYSTSVNPGNYTRINGNAISTVCNDPNGYSLYAIGYSGDSYDTPTNTQMIGTGSIGNIATGTATTGNTSGWAMQVTPTTGSAPTITNGFDSTSFHVVPAEYTQVAKYTSTTASPSATGASVDVKYQIYAAVAQAAGTYTGKVKYTMVHPNTAPAPTLPPGLCTDTETCMQTMTTCPAAPTTVTDSRDGRQYTVAPIGSDCWMTTNLDLAGGTALSADDTDVTSAYISSFTTSNNLTKSGDTIVLPASTTSSGFDTDNYSYVANSGNASSNCSNAPGCYSYYSWDAATVGSGRSITADNTDAPYSICPKGWHLPNTRTDTDDTSDFRKLMIALGGSSSIETYNGYTTPTGATMFSALQASPNNFLPAGSYFDGSFHGGGSGGVYWSSTSYSNSSRAFLFSFIDSRIVYSADYTNRYVGFSVRCVLGS